MKPKQKSSLQNIIEKTGMTAHPFGLAHLENLLKRVDQKKPRKILDLGCGAGHISAFLAKHYEGQIYAVDSSAAIIDKAKALHRYEKYFDRLHFSEAPLDHLPFADEEFDLVLGEYSLLFIEDKEPVVQEMKRVLKPGGFCVLTEFCLSEDADLKEIAAYLKHPALGICLCHASFFSSFFNSDHWLWLLHEEKPLDLRTELCLELYSSTSLKNLLPLLELGFMAISDKDMQKDLWNLLQYLPSRPKNLLQHLNILALVIKKKDRPKAVRAS